MRHPSRHPGLVAAAALAIGLSTAGMAAAESFSPSTEDTGMSWKAVNNEVYDTWRSTYRYPGGEVPSTAYTAPGLVYGGGRVGYPPAAYPPAYPPAYAGAPNYYPPAPPGY